MTMYVKITKRDNDPYQATVTTVDKWQEEVTKNDAAVLKKAGDEVEVYLTSTRSIEITEQVLKEEG